MQRYTLKFNFQIKFYFFIENLCFCSLKIAVYVLKIPIGRKKLKIPVRLKITEWSKNYYRKIPVSVRMYARVYARVYDCQDTTRHTTTTSTAPDTEHSRNTTTGKGRNTGKRKNKICDCWEI